MRWYYFTLVMDVDWSMSRGREYIRRVDQITRTGGSIHSCLSSQTAVTKNHETLSPSVVGQSPENIDILHDIHLERGGAMFGWAVFGCWAVGQLLAPGRRRGCESLRIQNLSAIGVLHG